LLDFHRARRSLDVESSLAKAKAAFREAANAATESGDERDLSVLYNRIGDVQVAQGNLPEALKSFRDGLGIRERLARADPENSGWQRDLSVSYNKIGDVQVAQGHLPEALKGFRDGLGIAERLAKADPENSGWQRDLSVSYDRVGDVQVAQGNLPEALKSFRDGLGIAERLAKADPIHAGWQRDLSVSYGKLGSLQLKGISQNKLVFISRRVAQSSHVWSLIPPVSRSGNGTSHGSID
jgi:tetratricopeptide (TPR) repeat protein